MQPAWLKIKGASQYCSLSVRTLRDLLKSGLRHSRLPSGTILIRAVDIDEFFGTFAVKEESSIDQIVDDVTKDLSR